MSSLSSSALKSLDGLLDDYPSKDTPGTVVGVVNGEGKVLYLKAVGTSNIDSGVSMKQDQVFWIASCTKMVVGIAAMQLVEQGKLSLDAPVAPLVPELAEVDLITSSSSAEIKTRKTRAPITLRMLLTHTAGFGYHFFNEHLMNWYRVNGTDEFSGEALPQPLVNEPGQEFEYGINIDWAGIAIERATGLKLGDYCQKHIFEPLGLKDLTFDLPKRPDMSSRLHTLHRRDLQTGKYTTQEHVIYTRKSPTVQSGGAGMFATVADYLGIITVLLREGRGANGRQILKPETVKYMFQDHAADVPKRRALDEELIPASNLYWTGSEIQLLPGIAKGWGLTFMINKEDVPGGRKAYSAEWYGISNCNWHADPSSGVGTVIFNSSLPFVDVKAFGLMAQIHKVLYAPGSIVNAYEARRLTTANSEQDNMTDKFAVGTPSQLPAHKV